MARKLSVRVAANAAATASRYAKNRAAFLALRDEIKPTLDGGWSVKEIWRTLYKEGKVTFGYSRVLQSGVHFVTAAGSQVVAAVAQGAPIAIVSTNGGITTKVTFGIEFSSNLMIRLCAIFAFCPWPAFHRPSQS